MNYSTITKAIAETVMEGWIRKNNQITTSALSPDYEDLQKKLRKVSSTLGGEIKQVPYQFDLNFGIELYESLISDEDFNLRIASNDGFWYHLTMLVIPDVVSERWSIEQANRFYKQSNRIWLKTLFWYIHLSWQGDKETTLDCLAGNSTDTIVQLTERPTSKGYSIELFRSIMKELGELNKKSSKANVDYFRRLMKLNTAYLKTLDPELFKGGIDGYVDWLFIKTEV